MPKVMRLDRKRLSTTWSGALDEYITWKRAQGLREITLKGHRDVIGLFFRRHPEAWDGKLTEAAYAFMGEKIKPATYNIRRNYLRQFLAWAVKEGFLDSNPLASLKKRRDEGRLLSLDEETLKRLLALPDRKTFAGLRDYALLCLTLDTGIRPKEAFSLLKADVNLSSLEVRVPAEVAKTGASRTVPITSPTANAIRELNRNRHPGWGESAPVFCTAEGSYLRNDTWGDRLEVYAKILGVKFHPYALRHSFATCFLKAGGNALVLQRIMGHSTLEMTRRYVHLNQEDIKAQHGQASPLARVLTSRRIRKLR